MDLLQVITQAQGGDTVRHLGEKFGLDGNQTRDALSALLPSLAGAVKQNASSPNGLESLMGALHNGDHSRYLDDPEALAEASNEGNGILGHLFGDKQVSREVAARASAQTGIGADVLKKMLPVVASMVMGGLSKRAPGVAVASTSGFARGGLMDMLTPMLDRNRDGSAMDDILGMAKGFLQR
jgi:hypothetical protein